ncbi:MAG TPA: IPTL-CTERM sorting domain-containing protein [Desulfobacteraceae bacterium]|nr:IPTL-CTERM sorting domain-containing protein [Desulfobacteraceae bacterium]
MAAPVSVPTMNEWGMILFSLLIAGVFLWFIRRQNKKSC